MDGCDFYDYFVGPLQAMNNLDLGALADHALADGWYLTQNGRGDVVDKIADAIYAQYVDTGACDTWGPATFFDWYVDGVLNKPKVPNMDVVH